jgi:anti-sigma factor RsiW
MGVPLPVSEAELQAHVDGRLPAERRVAVESWLAARPDMAERVAAYRQLGEALRAAYGQAADDPVPLRLQRLLDRKPARKWLAQAAAGFVAGVALAGLAAWALREPPQAAQMVREAAVAHAVYSQEMRHAVEVGAADKAHLQAWLSERLAMKVQAPDLESAGMALVGGRLLPGKTRPVAMLMYEAQDGRRATLYWAPDLAREPETGLAYALKNNVRVFYWLDAECGYALASQDLGKEELSRLAGMAHDQLEK